MNTNDIFPPAAPDFRDPLGLLRACHERILKHCDTLERLAAHLATQELDAQAREAAAQLYKYFTTAGRHHHQDEELEVFPRLARQSLKLADRVYRLKQQHQQLDTLWEQLAPLLARPATIQDVEGFTDLAHRLATAYRDHIAEENEELLEVAQHIFSNDDLKHIGEKMAERRGLQLR